MNVSGTIPIVASVGALIDWHSALSRVARVGSPACIIELQIFSLSSGSMAWASSVRRIALRTLRSVSRLCGRGIRGGAVEAFQGLSQRKEFRLDEELAFAENFEGEAFHRIEFRRKTNSRDYGLRELVREAHHAL
jgi:hypothetical protein